LVEAEGMTTFGESAPARDLLEHFGITPERVAAAGRAAMARAGG
jgi:transketolase